jgi:hypothetical protein
MWSAKPQLHKRATFETQRLKEEVDRNKVKIAMSRNESSLTRIVDTLLRRMLIVFPHLPQLVQNIAVFRLALVMTADRLSTCSCPSWCRPRCLNWSGREPLDLCRYNEG